MSKFLSGRQSNLNLGVKGYTENKTVLETTGRVGIGTTNAESFSLYVIGPTNITGIATFKSDVFIDEQLYVGGVNIIGGASIGQDVSARNLLISGISTFQGSVHHPDDVVVNFGDSDDLKIYHDSSGQSYIKDVGTGDLNLTSNGTGIHLQSGSGESLARFNNDGSADLYYDSQRKFATSGIGATVFGRLDSTEVNVSSAGTFGGLIDANGGIDATSVKVEDLTNDRIVLAGVGGELEDSPNLTFDGGTLNVVGHTELDNLNVSGIATIQNIDIRGEFDAYAATATFHNNLHIDGNLSIGGTTTTLQAQDLQIFDKDIILGVTTDAQGNDISTDITANHAGVAVASTTGFPLVNLTIPGVEELPATYKKIMWFRHGAFAGLGTDAWLFNYAVGIGSTQFPSGTRLAAGQIQITEDTVNTPNLDVANHTELETLNVSGVSTFQGNVNLGDNDKLIFGDDDDLEIFHNSSNGNTIIQETTGGNLVIKGSNLFLQSSSGEDFFKGDADGAVTLYYDDSKKFETTGYGVTVYNDLRVGTGVTIYGNAGIVSAISFYGDGSNLTNTGATLSATSGVERLVTTQLTSGTMVDAATDADLTFDAGTNTLNTQNIKISGGISTNGSAYGQDGQLLKSTGTGWEWQTVPGIFSVNNILNGFNVLEEGSTVGTAGSIHTIDFRGINVTATADPAPNGIATVTFSSTPTFTDLTVLNNTTIPNVIGITTFSNNVNVGSAITMYASTGIISATKFYGDGSNLLNTGATLNPASGTQRLVLTSLTSGTMVDAATDSDLTYDAISDKLNVANLDISGITTLGGPVTAGSSEGVAGQYLRHVGTGVTWANFPTLRTTQTNTATAGQTAFNFTYNVDFLDVFVNGVKLSPSEYTATNGNQIVLNTPAFADEVVEFHSYNITSTYGGGGGGGGASNLNGLSDVTIGTLANGQLLQYNSSSGEWENISAATVVGAASSFATKVATATTATAGQTTFNGTYTVGFVDVFLNGVKQSEDQYTATTGTNVVFNDGASEDDIIEVVGLTANVPGPGGGGSSYTNSDVDSHINVSGATSGQILSWNGSDYAWVTDQSGGGSIAGIDTTATSYFNNIDASGTITANSFSGITTSMISDYGNGLSSGGSSGISLTDLSVTTAGTPLQLGALAYNNSNGVFTFTPPDIEGQSRQALSVGTANNPLQIGAISYDNGTGVLTYTPPDLSSYQQKTGDGSALTGIVTSIVAGTNVTVTNSGGTYTINSSGGGSSGPDPVMMGMIF